MAAVYWEEMKMLSLAFWVQARWQSDAWLRHGVAAKGVLQTLTYLSSLASEGLEGMFNSLLLKVQLRHVLRCFVEQNFISLHALLN